MGFTPNRIVLIARGRYDEAPLDAPAYPGMLMLEQADGGIIPHNIAGGNSPLNVLIEDAFRGADITQILNTNDAAPFYRAARGDKFLMLLQNGQNVARRTPLVSAGDGTLVAGVGNAIYEIEAASTTVTNTVTETTFSNGSFVIPANSLNVGDRLNIRVKVFAIAENSTNTHDFKLYFGATVIADTTALQFAANDVAIIEMNVTIRTIGASGTFIADGQIERSVAGTFTVVPVTVASTAVDTTATQTVKVTTTASAASAGNQVRLDEMDITDARAIGGSVPLVYADEAINNSGGTGTSGFNTAAFIRCFVP